VKRALVYYVTTHGYGHGARSCDVLSAVLRRRPELTIHLISDLPESFLAPRLPAGDIHYRKGSFDVGMVQLDSVRVDVPATLRAARDLLAAWPAGVIQEVEYLKRVKAGLVVADIPGLPIQAAHRSGLPALAVGNFAWDWIYEPFAAEQPGWQPVVDTYRAAYADCDVLLRLPFHEPMRAFARQMDIPLLARPGVNRREALAAHTGADPATTWVLLSFSTLEWNREALDRVNRVSGCTFFTVRPLVWAGPRMVAVDRHQFPYADVMASCDVVVTKPGYGVMQECAVNDKPMVYVERKDFREYPILAAALKRHFRSVHLPAHKLYRGELGEALAAIPYASAPKERLEAGGDDQAAREIISRM
jgi:hypothetical protein